jgi:serine/threonine-protein kinase
MSDQTRIDALVLRYEELRAQGKPISSAELCRDCPELLDELRRQLRVLDAMDALLGPEGAADTVVREDAGPAAAAAPAEAVAAAARYRVLRLHATGGLGEVLVAHDEQLGRAVALKRLQRLHAQNPKSRSRFLREAEITSRLEHPSIVPVHAVGQDADGRPFYAMRFVQGETLHQAIQRFHAAGAPGRDPGERRLAFRQLLGRLVAVCNTLAYAHSQGIVHRDVKPDNIVLGPYGETLLVDWGLAKAVGPEAAESGGEAASAPAETTHPGAVVGTPAYMSPEQAAGRVADLGPASDVYSLGATLYCLLTGQAPFRGAQVAEVLDQVRRGDFLPPRQRKKDVPRALEAVCLKAMARAPGERYASALDVAADLEHWLAGEPVGAWREPWPTRARRWFSRHRTVAAAAAAALGVAVVSLAVAAVLLQAANTRERQARALALEQRDEARRQQEQAAKNYQLARRAVDQSFTLVSQDPRLREHDLEGLRKELLQAAAQFCTELVEQHSTDPEGVAEQGRAYSRLGLITQEIGSREEAIRLCRQARDVFTDLARAYPDAAYRQELGKCQHALAVLLGSCGRPAEALEAGLQARALRADLVAQHPAEAAYQEDLILSHNALGALHMQARRFEEARAELSQARERGHALVEAHPGDQEGQARLADAYLNLGVLYHRMGRPLPVIEEELRLALAVWEKLAAAGAPARACQTKLAYVHNNLAILYRDHRRPGEAEAHYRKALALREELARTHPTVSDYQHLLARTYHNLGDLYQRTARGAEAEAAFHKALDIHKRLAEAHPTVTGYAVDLGRAYGRLGHLLKLSNPSVALDWLDQSRRTHEGVLRRQPGHAEARECLSDVHEGRATALTQLGRPAEAIPDWDRAVELADGANRVAWRLRRARTLAQLGEHVRATAEAEALTSETSAPGGVLYGAACVYGCASAAARAQAGPSEPSPTRLAEEYAVRALALLARARTAGYFRDPAAVERLQKDRDLDPLRAREGFKELLADVGPKARPDSP